MSVSKWAWTKECEGKPCPGDCDLCSFPHTRGLKPLVYNPVKATERISELEAEVERLKDLNNQLRIKVRIMEADNVGDNGR